MNRWTKTLCVAFIIAFASVSARAEFADFSSQLQDEPVWTAQFAGSTVTALFNTGFEGSLIQMLVPEGQTTKATRIDFHTDNPFPETARLIVMDLDGTRERVKVVSNNRGIAAPVQYETILDSERGPSVMPTWNPATDILQSQDLKQNDREASVFDIGGLSHVSVTLAADQNASSWYAIATAVPEPTSICTVLACVAFGWLRRR